METLVDTSALYALLDGGDAGHRRVAAAWAALLAAAEPLLTTNYVLAETTALVQARLGLAAVRALASGLAPVLHIIWVEESLHHAGLTAFFTAARRDLSLVDCVSFEAMRRHGIARAFALDRHFRQQGFEILP